MRPLLALLLLALPALADRAVTTGGDVWEGEGRVEGETLFWTAEGKRRERDYPCARFLLVEEDGGAVIWARDRDARLRGYELMARARARAFLAELAEQAYDSRDAALARQVFDAAERFGWAGKEADKLKKRIEVLEGKSPRVREDDADAVRESLAAMPAFHADLLVARARLDTGEDGLHVLRAALRLDPEHAGARALLAERAPEGWPYGSPVFWLDFRLDLEPSGARIAPADDPLQKEMRRRWRPDLYAVRAGPIRLFTPVLDTRTVGRCLAYGTLTCRALADLFATDAPRPRRADSLAIHLYGSREEYLAATGATRPGHLLQFSAGAYSPSEHLSRLYWHTDPDAERRIARTFVHELTHHWIQELNPRTGDGELLRDPTLPGFWIVEGIATFVNEGSYDVETMRYDLFDARSQSLDVVQALAGSGKLLPWTDVYGASQAHLLTLGKEPDLPFVRAWALGTQRISELRLFYEQAAATCHFLYHGEGGRRRAALLDYVVSFYTGRRGGVGVAPAFGLAPDELGTQVVEHARRVADGWRPEGK